MAYAIEVKSLCKDFGSKKAVKDISFQVEEGCVFSLLGVNGAGKTTTIRMLSGLSKPTRGDAFVGGKSILTEMEKIKSYSAVSPQDTAIAPNLTVAENLSFIAEVYGMKKEQIADKMEELTTQFELGEVLNQKAKTLSGGWQRKVSIAMALITEPKILYLDEPTLGLDVLARRELWKHIEQLKGKMTVILTTHYMEEAEQLSDYVAIMVAGEIKCCGTVEVLKQSTNTNSLEEAFVVIAEEGKR